MRVWIKFHHVLHGKTPHKGLNTYSFQKEPIIGSEYELYGPHCDKPIVIQMLKSIMKTWLYKKKYFTIQIKSRCIRLYGQQMYTDHNTNAREYRG